MLAELEFTERTVMLKIVGFVLAILNVRSSAAVGTWMGEQLQLLDAVPPAAFTRLRIEAVAGVGGKAQMNPAAIDQREDQTCSLSYDADAHEHTQPAFEVELRYIHVHADSQPRT